MNDEEIRSWFISVVLPLEAQLLSYLGRHWTKRDEARDMLHDIYERALTGARRDIPLNGRAYVFAIARNLLISRARRGKIVHFDLVSDLDQIDDVHDELTPERYASSREELQRAIDGMERLPPRCREMVWLRKVEGLSTHEVADRLDVSPAAVERQITLGMRALADFMIGGSGRVKRKRRTNVFRLVLGGRDNA